METLKKIYEENKNIIHLSLPTIKKYIENGVIKGCKIVNITKRKQYYITDKDLFLSSFKEA